MLASWLESWAGPTAEGQPPQPPRLKISQYGLEDGAQPPLPPPYPQNSTGDLDQAMDSSLPGRCSLLLQPGYPSLFLETSLYGSLQFPCGGAIVSPPKLHWGG